jgi:hypothetical protein
LRELLDIGFGAGAPAVVHSTPSGFRVALDVCRELDPRSAALIQARPPREEQALLSALSVELREDGFRHRIWRRAPGLIQGRRALAGLDPGGETARRARVTVRRLGNQEGQVVPAIAGLLVAVIVLTLAFVALGGAVTAKGRAQRAVDLAALSAARSMKDDFPRLFVPAYLPNGAPNPAHMDKASYEARARAAAEQAGERNELPAQAIGVSFPDGASIAPMRVAVAAEARLEVGGERREETVEVNAEAALANPLPAAAGSDGTAMASGGGYSGPLAERQGQTMRPDVAAAFDRMAAAAAGAGVTLVINSAFRSDAEQAALFAANPDPRMVAPPGTSLHRCGTELDLGPSTAYGWLAANAGRFGFLQRYSWEPWHYGFTAGPEPCSAAGDLVGEAAASGTRGGRGGDGSGSAGPGLPGFVPPQYRAVLLAAAARHDVSPALLAAQLMAESNFNPAAVSPAGAQGIAQFMPGTAAAYGLTDPFDAEASIEAQATLMGELMEQFGDPRLALAAYNAGPAPVSACACVPGYAETQAYVAKIMAMLDGAGQLAAPAPSLEIRLVD